LATNYGIAAYKFFTEGPLLDYRHRGSLASKEITIGLRDNAAFALDANSLAFSFGPGVQDSFQRELAYHIRAHIHAGLAGYAPRTARYAQLLDWGYEYFEKWFEDFAWVGGDVGVHTFMIGVLARALIEDHETSGDARLQPALTLACNWIRTNSWDASRLGFLYQNNAAYRYEGGDGTNGASTVGSPDLNNLIGPMFAYLAKLTGDESYMQLADLSFAGSALNAGYTSTLSKQFNQSHTWVFDYFRWRHTFYNPPSRRNASRLRRLGR
jgi:hypothetical protein